MRTEIVERIFRVLEKYAQKGVFRGFSRGTARAGRVPFKMFWHRDRYYDLILDPRRKTLRMPGVLPMVPAKSAMYREFREYIESRHSTDLPPHRRIDSRKARLSCENRRGNVGVVMTVRDGDYEYATRKLINAIHEIFLGFLTDGPYYDYQIEAFGLDPDRATF